MSRYENIYREAADRYGLSPTTLSTFARIESGHNPNVRTGSYRGLFQLSPSQFRKFGGTGSIFDPRANTMAGAAKIANLKSQFVRQFGRDPSMTELYMMHQQGPGGAAAHLRNPDRPAWMSMYSTAEGRQKGPAWAKRAIWGNVPTDVRRKYGSVENMTSADFVNMWDGKVRRLSGTASSTQDAPGVAPVVTMSDTRGAAPGSYRAAQEVGIGGAGGGGGAAFGSFRAAQEEGFGPSGPIPAPEAPKKTFSQLMGEYWSDPAYTGPPPWALADALGK